MNKMKPAETERDILKREYVEDVRQAQYAPSGNESIPPYLGESMGEYEWSASTYEANKKFVDVEAYENFKESYSLILVGRTGTGKTSLLKKLEYEVNQGEVHGYSDVLFVKFGNFITQISNFCQIDGTKRTYDEIIDNVEKFIMLSVMKHIAFNSLRIYRGDDIKVIKKYLSQAEVTETSDFGDVLKMYVEKIHSEGLSDILSVASLFSTIIGKLFNADYYKAAEAVKRIFSDKDKILVLIDTMEEYKFSDTNCIVSIKSLMRYTFECYSTNKFISIKMALPSELYSFLRESIPAKQMGNTVFIEWKYRDLIKLIAMRCYFLFTESNWKEKFKCPVNEKYYQKISKDYTSAKEFLYSFIPDRCNATINLSFDTLSYIVRHTQKKPRQLMMVFQSILHKIVTQSDMLYYFNNSTELKTQIHLVQDNLISDSLNMYAETYPRIVEICSHILSQRGYIIPDSELTDYIKKSDLNDLMGDSLNADVIKSILIQSGLIGTYNEDNIRFVPKYNSWFRNPNVIKIIPALYEYQIKGRLAHNEKSEYVVHPICYENYNMFIDYNCLVYPESYDNTDETFCYLSSLNDYYLC